MVKSTDYYHTPVSAPATIILPARQGSDPDTVDSNGDNLVHLAVKNGSLEQLQSAISLGVSATKKNYRRLTPLEYYLCQTNRPDIKIVTLLINAGADCNSTNSHGENLAHLAVRYGTLEHLKAAITLGVNLNKKNYYGYTPYQWYINNIKPADMNVIRLLVAPETRQSRDVLNEITQSFNYKTITKYPDSGELVCRHLSSHALPPEQIRYLGRSRGMKERVLAHIQSLPNGSEQKALVDQALDATTMLGQFFAVQRGWFRPRQTRGTLAVLVAMQRYLETNIIVTASAPPYDDAKTGSYDSPAMLSLLTTASQTTYPAQQDNTGIYDAPLYPSGQVPPGYADETPTQTALANP